MSTRKLIFFDWAMKKLLRGKANFGILEGFLSELLRDDIRILEVLDTESNKDDARDKYNRVDLKVKNAKGEILVIEVQYERELDYLQRILYATSRILVEHMQAGAPYSAKGLREAKTKLDVMKLPSEERRAYAHYLEDLSYQASMVESSYGIGRIKGRKEGEKKGRIKGEKIGEKRGDKRGRLSMAKALKEKGVAWPRAV